MLKIGFSVFPFLCYVYCIWHIDRKLLNHKRTLEKNRSKLLENSRVLDSKYVFELTTEHSEILHIQLHFWVKYLDIYQFGNAFQKRFRKKLLSLRDSNEKTKHLSVESLPLASKQSNNSMYRNKTYHLFFFLILESSLDQLFLTQISSQLQISRQSTVRDPLTTKSFFK